MTKTEKWEARLIGTLAGIEFGIVIVVVLNSILC